jgi:hypothetical protein
LRVEGDWGRFQASKVMPGNGTFTTREWTSTELQKIHALASSKDVTVDEGLGILGEKCVDVYLNGAAFWAAVPINVWDYMLSGYQILKK